MFEQTLDIATKDGATETFICHPDRGGPLPGGDADDGRAGAYARNCAIWRGGSAGRVLCAGAEPLLPRGPRYALWPRRADARRRRSATRMRAVRTKMTIPPVMDDVAAMLAHIDGRQGGEAEPSQRPRLLHERPLRARRRRALFRPRVAAAASFYGTWLINDAEESPHLGLRQESRASSISPAPSTTTSLPSRWSRNSAPSSPAPAPAAGDRLYPTVHHGLPPSRSAGATTSPPPSGIGNG